MSWYLKKATTLFDELPIAGLYFLDGDIVSQATQTFWTMGMKAPLIEFPSGITCEIWGGRDDKQDILVHFFGEMDLLLFTDRNAGFRQALVLSEEIGYGVKKNGENELEIVGFDRGEHLIIIYDNALKSIVDVKPAPRPSVAQPRALLDDASRAKLPPLYSNEKVGLNALAQVKFFTPDGNWTWFASEGSPVDKNGYFDTDKEKVDYLFFGLVIGLEIELGYFSLSELTGIRGALGLPIERDLHYEPKTLGELQKQYRTERGEG